ncbi:MAG TPA: IS1595 family transposase [Mobilitalea sp.]|nr:IS1595 family transposase [Mobilitalea sp.]
MKKYINPKVNTYSLPEFQKKYGTEADCENALFHLKWHNGFICSKCFNTDYYTIGTRRLHLYQCKHCGHQETVTTGTIMQNSKLSLTIWFLALYFIAQNKDGIAELSLAKYIGVTLKTAWALLHKVRRAMGSRDSMYKLGGNIEMDEAFFGGNKEGKRGRGSENKVTVAVALQVDDGIYPKYLKMQVIPDCKGETLKEFALSNIRKGSTIHSDKFKSYYSLEKDYKCDMQKYNPADKSGFLKWVHVMISNIKSNIEGTYHGLDNNYLQNYLDEFCYRLNRRDLKVPVFDKLLKCCTTETYLRVSELCI